MDNLIIFTTLTNIIVLVLVIVLYKKLKAEQHRLHYYKTQCKYFKALHAHDSARLHELMYGRK